MKKEPHTFTLVLRGDLEDDAVLDALYDAGCADATFGIADGVPYADFHREASSFTRALLSAIRDVERAGRVRVVRVEPDDLVTMADIARRLGVSREYVRLLISGGKGQGDFPAPVSNLLERSKFWRWSDVARWKGLDAGEDERARFTAAVNAALDLRNTELSDADRTKLLKLSASR